MLQLHVKICWKSLDWIGHRKSISRYYIFVWGNSVVWRSKKQSVVARSSIEAEYRAMEKGACEVVAENYS